MLGDGEADPPLGVLVVMVIGGAGFGAGRRGASLGVSWCHLSIDISNRCWSSSPSSWMVVLGRQASATCCHRIGGFEINKNAVTAFLTAFCSCAGPGATVCVLVDSLVE
jgi:hypothetical protein